MKKIFELKEKNFNCIVIYLKSDNSEIIKKYLENKIKIFPKFFNNSPVVINISSLSPNINWIKIKKIITSMNLFIMGFTGCNNEILKKKIIKSGTPFLTTKNKKFLKYQNNKIVKKNYIINTPVRSGQKIYSRNADLIIINNVSSGAEVISNGNIHIYGSLYGRALAGANGNQESQIFCTKNFSELISISGEYWLIDQIPKKLIGKSVNFYLKNGFLDALKLN
ncbi:septum site-determining protein MinC [Buchnera aphidicola (Kurisakia onigurumii)]|uniref:septum site-determining protein MinC n=1 Tax=Buchnera aphidicola TaxID=9 RepID=UPI0031B725D1